jgi:uncharacterized protein (TIGR02145 family)
MKKIILLLAALAFLTLQNYAQTVTDIDGNVYNVVIIGTHKWLQQDLRARHYNNGDSIPNITDGIQWGHTYTSACCDYNNNPVMAETYGKLYNWYAVTDNRNLCPLGWHVANDADWDELTAYLGGYAVAGGKIKEAGTSHWQSPNTGADNSSGFTARPSGMRFADNNWNGSGFFYGLGLSCHWWTTVPFFDSVVYVRAIYYDTARLSYELFSMSYGFPVRCVNDTSTASINENEIKNFIRIYPNPSSELIIIECPENKGLNLYIYNDIGDLVMHRESSGSKEEINISALPAGVYIIKVTGMDWTVQRKIIKE